jgi:NAD(P)-dependent dehydrogenase (short-subunit alcohol dehydrogenase family)
MKRATVVGASQGIGLGVFEKLEKLGYDLVTMQRRPGPGSAGYVLISGGMGAYQHSVYASAAKAIARERKEAGEHDLAAEMAAVAKALGKHGTTAMDQMKTNALGPGHVLECAYPYLAEDDGGRAVVIGSLIIRNCPADLAWYGASKAAIDSFVHASARRWAKRNVQCNCLATGWIWTPMIADIEERKAKMIKKAIGSGQWGTVEGVAESVRWLLEDADAYMTAGTLPMGGGL